MQCTNCGKDIPFTGQVCPWCHTDKSTDQLVLVAGMGAGIAMAVLGYLIAGEKEFVTTIKYVVGGGLMGTILGSWTMHDWIKKKRAIIAQNQAIAAQQQQAMVTPGHSTQAPGPIPQDVESRLNTLEGLRKKGLVSEEEYRRKKDDILKSV